EGLSPVDWRRLNREAWEFVDDGNSLVQDDPEIGSLRDEANVSANPQALRDLQEAVRRGIRAVSDGRWGLGEGVPKDGIARWRSRVVRGCRVGGFRVLFQAIALDIVETHWSEMRECPWCRQWFLRKGKQAFCSPVCSQKSRWTRFASHRRPRDYRAEREH